MAVGKNSCLQQSFIAPLRPGRIRASSGRLLCSSCEARSLRFCTIVFASKCWQGSARTQICLPHALLRLRAIVSQEALVDQALWATKPLSDTGFQNSQYSAIVSGLFRAASVALASCETMKAFLVKEPSDEDIREVSKFQVNELQQWSRSAQSLADFSAMVKPVVDQAAESVRLKAFHAVHGLVQMCLQGGHCTFKKTDADRVVEVLPPTPLHGAIQAFAQVGVPPRSQWGGGMCIWRYSDVCYHAPSLPISPRSAFFSRSACHRCLSRLPSLPWLRH